MPTLLLYGATGYTGRLICDEARKLDLEFIVAGRNHITSKTLARSLEVEYRVFDLKDDATIHVNLKDIAVLLNCAGPFAESAEPLMRACIQNTVHYLDISAELVSYELAKRYDQAAHDAGVMLMPGCGGSVAMFSCLAGYFMQMASSKDVNTINIALHVSGSMSRGSAISASRSVTNGVLEVRDGVLSKKEDLAERSFDFAKVAGSVACSPVTLPDLMTLRHLTSALSISCYVHASGTAFSNGDLNDQPDGPTLQEREANPYHAVARAAFMDGTEMTAVLHTVNGYTFTSIASAEAARRVLARETQAGFRVPADAFGSDFVCTVPGSKMFIA